MDGIHIAGNARESSFIGPNEANKKGEKDSLATSKNNDVTKRTGEVVDPTIKNLKTEPETALADSRKCRIFTPSSMKTNVEKKTNQISKVSDAFQISKKFHNNKEIPLGIAKSEVNRTQEQDSLSESDGDIGDESLKDLLNSCGDTSEIEKSDVDGTQKQDTPSESDGEIGDDLEMGDDSLEDLLNSCDDTSEIEKSDVDGIQKQDAPLESDGEIGDESLEDLLNSCDDTSEIEKPEVKKTQKQDSPSKTDDLSNVEKQRKLEAAINRVEQRIRAIAEKVTETNEIKTGYKVRVDENIYEKGDRSVEEIVKDLAHAASKNKSIDLFNPVTGKWEKQDFGKYSPEVWKHVLDHAIANYNQRILTNANLKTQTVNQSQEVVHGGSPKDEIRNTQPSPSSKAGDNKMLKNIDNSNKVEDIKQATQKNATLKLEKAKLDRIENEKKAIDILMEKIEKFIKTDREREANRSDGVKEEQIKDEDFGKLIYQTKHLMQDRQMPITREIIHILKKVKTIIDKSPDDITNKDIHILHEMLTQLVISLLPATGIQTISGLGKSKTNVDNQ